MSYAKVCNKCQRIVLSDAKVCSGSECGGTEFTDLILTPFWDSVEAYTGQEEEDESEKI